MALASDPELSDVLAGDGEHLNAAAAPIRDVHKTIIRDFHGVDWWYELRRSVRARRLRRCGATPTAAPCSLGRGRIIHRNVAEGSPHPFVGACIGVEDDDPLVSVTVRDEQLICLRI